MELTGLIIGVAIGGAVAATSVIALIALVIYKTQHPLTMHGHPASSKASGGGMDAAEKGPKRN
ncbi:hypothetical protein [Crucian carp herpesvirus]|uniref:ORF106 n=1 Tax=Cyprinid herpesvirus 2 TaxID=317878 RepID=K7PCF7_CYHV2|nr:protein ORF106 [Cyprinid herpesvirus 2]APB92950.1 hypothetical protein [Crucian carp herpesvirus]AFJ20597.1 protein ORF106 [Cyprinid herpesvirus 2]AMB21674.1 ORF106 [Cyprinid herpesvirus 2]QAU54827.1 protein ORF106 [Cyprinid herpesvirus 2]QIM55275.1 hypothetical protein [Cyprinid herpesvirus 2]